MDGTGQVGTYFYTAPEIEQKWPQINETVSSNLGLIIVKINGWILFVNFQNSNVNCNQDKFHILLENLLNICCDLQKIYFDKRTFLCYIFRSICTV